jgi:beta-barrel assembly-enhancing protease
VLQKFLRNTVQSLFSLPAVRTLAIPIPALLLGACASQGMQPETGAKRIREAEAGLVSPSPTAVATQRDLSNQRASSLAAKSRLRKWAQQQDRLYEVASPLLLKNASLCKKKTYLTAGIVTQTKYSYSDDFVEAAEQELGLSDRLQVMNVMSGSGADKSGLRRGDILLGIENHELPSGPKAEQEAARLMASAMRGKSSVRLKLARDGSDYVANVPLTSICAIDVELGNSDYVNAYSDGKRSLITAGMLEYVQSDAELAIVVAKEIAHNLVIQGTRPHLVTTIDSLRSFDISVKSSPASTKIRPYTAVRDATADKYSIYLLAKAGYNIDKVVPFWKRLAGQFPATQPNSYTALHPATPYRLSVMTAVSGVVKHHLKHGLPLVPN